MDRRHAPAHRRPPALLAAALAVHGPARHHGARHRRSARRLLEPVLVGTAPAARALTAFVPVDPGRPLTERLHHALHATRDAVDYERATGRPDAFDTAVAAGAGRELTEALITLVHRTQGAAVTLAWAPAAGPPGGCAARPEPVEFTPGDLPALRRASVRYLSDEPAVPVRVTGTVVRLRRAAPHGPGTVRLRVLTGADVSHLRVTLDEDGYRTAVRAHLAGLPLRVAGRLESRSGFRHLTGARGQSRCRSTRRSGSGCSRRTRRTEGPGTNGFAEGECGSVPCQDVSRAPSEAAALPPSVRRDRCQTSV